jgi:hemolysin activation/secretion protein
MIRGILLVISLFTLQNTFAQMCPCKFGNHGDSDKIKRHELSFNAFSIHKEPYTLSVQQAYYSYNIANGLAYKLHLNPISIVVNYNQSKADYDLVYGNNSTENLKSNLENFRIGIEKTFATHQFMSFYSGLYFNQSKGKIAVTQNNYYTPNVLTVKKYDINNSSTGASISLGFRAMFLKRFSFSLETSFGMMHYQSQSEVQYRSIDDYRYNYNPIQNASLNFHF